MPATYIARAARLSRVLVAVTLVVATLSLLSTQPPRQKQAELSAFAPALNAQVSSPEAPAVEGWVTAKSSGRPVGGAAVRVGGRATVSGPDGYFSFTASALNLAAPADESTFIPLRVEVEASPFSIWVLDGAKFYHGDTLRLYPKLLTKEQIASPPSAPIFSYSRDSRFLDTKLNEGLNTPDVFSPYATALTPPATIRVYRTATGVVEVVPFRDYVKYVLPNEWVPSWGAESLKAGAMAVKSYAWYWISVGGKQVAFGADVKDNVDDQVYDPNVSYASTDAAVDATFNYAITRGGALFQAQYCAGSYAPDPAGECPWPSQYMTQWGSAFHADQGRSWGWILQFYYAGSTITPQPPGGGYSGPPPTVTPAGTLAPRPPLPPTSGFSVGQGSERADLFQAGFDRNGGAAALGRPLGPVRWWMQYVSEFNVVAQPFSGPDGRGNVWLVYDVLKGSLQPGQRAFLLSGDLATAYAEHSPPGPEWIGAPTSDPYVADPARPGTRSQGFTKGTLVETGRGAQFFPWQESFSGWKAEYFPGHQAPSANLQPPVALSGAPASVRDIPNLKLEWPAGGRVPQSLGLGSSDWSAQFTKNINLDAGTYDFTLRADSGVRLWVDGMLAINGWGWDSTRSENYTIALSAGGHAVRVQYYSLGPSASLELKYGPRGTVAQPTVQPAPPVTPSGRAALRVRVQWLGRQAAPSDSWVQPLTLLLSNPGDAKVISSYRGMTDRDGVAVFQGLPAGIFNVHVKGAHSLQSARASITLANDLTGDVDMKAQVEGDTNGDNCVTVDDFAFVQSLLGTGKDTPGFNPAADLNGDGVVSMTDVSLLRSGFDRCGDISADNEFQPMALLAGSTLSQQLSPWLNPELLTKGLGMSLVASSTRPRTGEVIEVKVQVATGSQAVDGASILVRYDPAQLVPVDTLGRPTKAVEPGAALPSVMGNWIDTRGGLIGYSAGIVQGAPPSGEFTVAIVRFRLIGTADTTTVGFERWPPGAVQLTNGGTDLLGQVVGLTLTRQP